MPTGTADPAMPATGSRLDDLAARLTATRPGARLWTWGGPAVVLVVAAALRLWNLGSPTRLVFDETYYVKDAFALLARGTEAAWPDGADDGFAAGTPPAVPDEPGFVVHPPLGKWLIALGMAALGPESPAGWRIAVALGGVALVALVMVAARLLTDSRLLTVLAGGLLAIDAHAIAMSRVALLDGLLAVFVLGGVVCAILDRRWHAERLTARSVLARGDWGPVVWWRPWLLAAGVLFGASCSVKWSGLWFLAVFGLVTVLLDALLRRRLGFPAWVSAGLLTQGPVSFLTLVPVAVAVYVASWSGWLATAGGWGRDAADAPGAAWTGPLAWVPAGLQALWRYHESAYGYHVGLDQPHSYQSDPRGWLLMLRPTLMFSEQVDGGAPGCAAAECIRIVSSAGTPIIWWVGAAALLVLAASFVRHRSWQAGFVLAGVAAGYLPWLGYLDRTVFHFYVVAFEPFVILAIVLVVGALVGRPGDPRRGRTLALGWLGGGVALAALMSAFWYPMATGAPMPTWLWHAHLWLPGWR